MAKGDIPKEVLEQTVKNADDVGEATVKGIKKVGDVIGSVFGWGKKKAKQVVGPVRNEAGKVRPIVTGLKYLAGLGAPALGGYVGYNTLKSQAPSETIDWAAVLGTKDENGKDTPAPMTAEGAINKYLEALKTGGGGGGGSVQRPADLSKQYAKLTGISNLTGAASLAAMQRLADQAAATSTGIRARGDASGRSVQDIYGAAAAAAAEGAKLAGTEGASLTPVSGLAATLPAELRASGATLGNYLAQNQLISAQDAGFLSQLAQQQAPAYANQISRQDELFRMADMARRQAEYQRQVAAANASRASAQNEARALGLKLMLEQDLKAAQQVPVSQIDPEAIEKEWNKIKNDKRKTALYAAENIKTLQDFAKYKVNELRQYQGE
jgi:hypothetical protein